MSKKRNLTNEELKSIEGGIEPITIALGLGTLAVSAFGAGYKFGSDLANRGRR